MLESMTQELTALLEATDELINAPDPALHSWQAYCSRRNRIFSRLKNIDLLEAGAQGQTTELRDLFALILEKDRVLELKIRHLLSKSRQEMIQAKQNRRLFNAYVATTARPSVFHRSTA